MANLLMLIVAVITSLYPIAIDFSFNAINNSNLKILIYIPIGIIMTLTYYKKYLIFIKLL